LYNITPQLVVDLSGISLSELACPTADLDMCNHKISNVSNPISESDVMNRGYWDTYRYTNDKARASIGDIFNSYGWATKNIDMDYHNIRYLADPVGVTDATNKRYVDSHGGYSDEQAIAAVKGDTDAAYITANTGISIPNNSRTLIDFDANSDVYVPYDYGGMYNAAHTDRLTIQKDGLYLISAALMWNVSTTGYRIINIKGGSSGSDTIQFDKTSWSLQNINVVQSGFVIAECSENDYIRLYVEQTSGGNLTCHVPHSMYGLWVTKIR